MIHDSKAEALEARGLYRRAAARWAEVIMLANDDNALEQAAKRRAECIHKAARPPVMEGNLSGLKKALNRTCEEMGLQKTEREMYRDYPSHSVKK